MSARYEPRWAAVILIQRGDPEIAGAIAEGMMAARGNSLSHGGAVTAPSGREPLGEAEGVEIVSAGADRQKIVAHLVRVAVGNTKTPEDYEIMMIEAEGLYHRSRMPGPLRVFAGKLLLGWALICLGVRRAYRAQDRVLGRDAG